MRQFESRKEMISFFEKNLSNGQNAEDLYTVLLNQSYPKSIINSCYNEAMSNLSKRKQGKIEKDLLEQQKTQKVEVIIPEKEPGFFGKLFGKKN